MSGKNSLIVIVLLTMLWPFFALAQTTTITNFRAAEHQGKWRLVFDASAPITYQQQELKSPPRLVFDIKRAQLKSAAIFKKNSLRKFNRNSPVNKIRFAIDSNADLRLVLDLKNLVAIHSFTLAASKTKPYRLVVDIQPYASRKTKLHQLMQPIMSALNKPKRPPRDIVIVIDPGHGGKDPGATGRRGTHEKNIVLAISKQLQKIINQQPGFKAVLTRRGDYYISLRRRLAIARRYHADMFIAVHADAYRNRQAHGASVYALSRRGATSEAAHWLAKRENKSELMGGVELSDKGHLLKSVLINLSQTATIRASLIIGSELIRSLDSVASLHHNKVEQAAFVVLKSPDIPSLLVETGFLSNSYEEKRLRRREYRQQLAQALMQGIKRYFQRRPPRGTWLAFWRDHPQAALRKDREIHAY